MWLSCSTDWGPLLSRASVMYRGSVQRFIPSFRIHFKKQAESEGELVDSRAPRPSSPFAGPVSSCGVRLPSLKPLHHLRRRLFPLLWRHQGSGDAVSSSDSSVSSEEGRHCQNHLLVSHSCRGTRYDSVC